MSLVSLTHTLQLKMLSHLGAVSQDLRSQESFYRRRLTSYLYSVIVFILIADDVCRCRNINKSALELTLKLLPSRDLLLDDERVMAPVLSGLRRGA